MPREKFQNLTEPMYYLLLAMRTPRHGYDAMQFIQSATGGRVRIGAGTMYALLSRFEKEKILTPAAEEGRRKIYRLTPKGEALLRLASILGISREETMACGDGENDASMIRMAGIGVVMANGDPQLKAEADYITDSNDEDGVAAALEKLALSGGLH